jgi:hypothetical protein
MEGRKDVVRRLGPHGKKRGGSIAIDPNALPSPHLHTCVEPAAGLLRAGRVAREEALRKGDGPVGVWFGAFLFLLRCMCASLRLLLFLPHRRLRTDSPIPKRSRSRTGRRNAGGRHWPAHPPRRPRPPPAPSSPPPASAAHSAVAPPFFPPVGPGGSHLHTPMPTPLLPPPRNTQPWFALPRSPSYGCGMRDSGKRSQSVTTRFVVLCFRPELRQRDNRDRLHMASLSSSSSSSSSSS